MNTRESGRLNHVDPEQAEERSRSEQVTVVRVDFGKTMLDRAREVQGVGSAEETGSRIGEEDSLYPLE